LCFKPILILPSPYVDSLTWNLTCVQKTFNLLHLRITELPLWLYRGKHQVFLLFLSNKRLKQFLPKRDNSTHISLISFCISKVTNFLTHSDFADKILKCVSRDTNTPNVLGSVTMNKGNVNTMFMRMKQVSFF